MGSAPSGFANSGAGAGPTGDGWQFRSNRSAEQIFRDLFRDSFFDPFANKGFAGSGDGFEAAQQVSINIAFEEAARGVRKDLQLNVTDDCSKCEGRGVQPGFKKVVTNLFLRYSTFIHFFLLPFRSPAHTVMERE
jgi:DnaJ family protein A protein 3